MILISVQWKRLIGSSVFGRGLSKCKCGLLVRLIGHRASILWRECQILACECLFFGTVHFPWGRIFHLGEGDGGGSMEQGKKYTSLADGILELMGRAGLGIGAFLMLTTT